MRLPAKLRLGACGMMAVAALSIGCDWRDFDTLQNQTPVLAIDSPAGLSSSNDFASVILPVAPPADGSSAAWFLTSATETTGVALTKLDASGGASALTLTGPALDELGGNPVTAMAEIPGTRTALLGAPTFRSLLTVDLASQTVSQFLPSSPLTVNDPLLGVGVAAGNLTGTTVPDLVVASSSLVHVFIDGSTTDIAPGAGDLTSCPITLSSKLSNHDHANRALVVGNLLASGPAIAIGTPGAAAPGSVSFFIATTTAVTCAGILDRAGDERQRVRTDAGDRGLRRRRRGGPAGRRASLPRLPLQGPGRAGGRTDGHDRGAPGERRVWRRAGGGERRRRGGRRGADRRSGRHPRGNERRGQRGCLLGAEPDEDDADPRSRAGRSRSERGRGLRRGGRGAPLLCRGPLCRAPPLLPLVGAPAKAFVYFTVGPTDPRAR